MSNETATMSFAQLAAKLLRLPARTSTLLVGIDGGGGAGKSTFARSLKSAFASLPLRATIVQMDDFFLPSSKTPVPANDGFVDGTIDWQRVVDQVISPLLANQSGRYQRYDWPSHALAEWHTVDSGGIVIVEGVCSLRRELAPLYDYRIWVECPLTLGLARGIARDGEKVCDRWKKVWMPAEMRHKKLHRPLDAADLIVDGSGETGIDSTRFLTAIVAR